MKDKIDKLLKDIWAFSKGNRTMFLSILWGCVEAGLIPITGGWLTFARIAFSAMGAYTLKKHQEKGFFTTKKITIE